VGDVASSFFYCNSGTMSGTFSNIEVGNTGGSTFYGYQSLIGTYENIKIGTCSNAFVSATSDINGYFDTIEIDGVGNNTKFGAVNLYGTFKNIKLRNTYDLFSVSNTNATFENIEFSGSSINKVFYNANNNLSGTFSNISTTSPISQVFYANGAISGYFKDITLGTVSTGFMDGGGFTAPVTIDNLKVNAFIGYTGDAAGIKIINSTIDARGTSNPVLYIGDGTIIERCKFLSDSSATTIDTNSTPNAQISFTITNYGISGNIYNDIDDTDPRNIDNSNIT